MKIRPSDCIYEDFSASWYKKWGKLIGFPNAKHAKFWEQAAICQALDERDMLKNNRLGLGLGVGVEQLASVFASRGARVVATDQDPRTEKSQQWDNGQLAHGKDSLYYSNIVKKDVFDRNVDFEYYDMNTDNKSYHDKFDFIWHNCVVGHLGSTKKSVDHLINSSKYIKKGGYLVFTTELNIASLKNTVSENSDTIIWTVKELENLFKVMQGVGLVAEPFRLRLGDTQKDKSINFTTNGCCANDPKFKKTMRDPSFFLSKIPFSNYALTPIILIFKKSGISNFNSFKKIQYTRNRIKNESRLIKYTSASKDLSIYYKKDDHAMRITPLNSKISVRGKAGSTKKITLKFIINSIDGRVFDDEPRKPFNRSPLVLATANPINRISKVKGLDWFSDNRPTTIFTNISLDKNRLNAPTYPRDLHSAKVNDVIKFDFDIKIPKINSIEYFCPVLEGVKDFAEECTVEVLIKPSEA